MDKVICRVGDKAVKAEIVKHNDKTVLVRLNDDNVIKRHRKKHILKYIGGSR